MTVGLSASEERSHRRRVRSLVRATLCPTQSESVSDDVIENIALTLPQWRNAASHTETVPGIALRLVGER